MSDIAFPNSGRRRSTGSFAMTLPLALAGVGVLALAIWLLGTTATWLHTYPTGWILPLKDWLGDSSSWLAALLKPAARLFSAFLSYPMDWANAVLSGTHWLITSAAIVALACWIGGIGLALAAALAVAYILASGYWLQSMNTLALVVVSVPLALSTGLAIGLLAYNSARLRPIVGGILDFMQTVPTFAYLVPLLVLFGFGPVVGLIASAIYAAPPMARNTLLGLQLVHPEIKEAAELSGANRLQKLVLVELPAASSQIMVGVNQTIMASLSMVIIAAVIGGFNDIGWEVLLTMRKAQFGESLLVGTVIVVFAMLMDRMSAKLATDNMLSNRTARAAALAIFVSGLVVTLVAGHLLPDAASFTWLKARAVDVSTTLDSLVVTYGDTLQAIKNGTLFYVMLPLKIGLEDAVLDFTWGFQWTSTHSYVYLAAVALLATAAVAYGRVALAATIATSGYILLVGVTQIPWPVMLAMVGSIAWRAGGWKLAAFAVLALAAILVSGLWDKAMSSVYLCATAVILCAIIGTSLGLLASVSPLAWSILRPICDALQTIPLFVFLIPVLMLFQIGEFSALIAIIAYAIVPIIRYTQYGVTTTPQALVESAQANGCTPWQMLLFVRLPYAVPSILLGINQTVLYAFAMLVIAALIGTTDLGQSIYVALGRADMGLGLSAGFAMALLAMITDRIVQGFAEEKKRAMGID